MDQSTNLISGVTSEYTVWAKDSDNDGEMTKQTDVKRLNIVGGLSGSYEWSQKDSLKGQQAASFEKLWWKRAQPDDEDFSMLKRQDNYTDNLKDNFEKADTDRNDKLDLAEFERFFINIRLNEDRYAWTGMENMPNGYSPTDQGAYDQENFGEKMMATFEACCSLNGKEETCSLSNFTKTEDIIRKWYSAGKMDVTGYMYNDISPSNMWLSHECKTLHLDHEDSITYLRVESGTYGVSAIQAQTKKQPQWGVSSSNTREGTRSYPNKNYNWIKSGSEFNKELFGFYGYEDAKTGDLNGLGFIVKDTKCVDGFTTDLGAAYSWVSPKKGTEKSPPVRPTEYADQIEKLEAQASQIADGKISEHDHDDTAETALIVITVLVYAALMALVAVLIYQKCKK